MSSADQTVTSMINFESKQKLIAGIRKHLNNNKTYHFRPIKIDGINIYVVLYGKYNVLNIETIFINCKVKISGVLETQKYSLYHFKYINIGQAIRRLEKIIKEYRIYNGELVSLSDYNMLVLEECILTFRDDEKCCICYKNTSDITTCNHSICLHCRETCLTREIPNCPVCRKINALEIYNNNSGLVNNEQFDIVKKAIHYDTQESKYGVDDDDNDDDEDDDDVDEEEYSVSHESIPLISLVASNVRVLSYEERAREEGERVGINVETEREEGEIVETERENEINWEISRTPDVETITE